MAIAVHSRFRVLPDAHVPSSQPKVESLSIIDAVVLYFAKSACVWFYNESLDTSRLISSLRKTLNSYPQWAGELRFAEYNPDATHIHRHKRLELSYGSSSDPGVECILAEASCPMSSMLPPDQTAKYWDATHVNYEDLLDSETEFALHDSKSGKGLPSMKVQFTTFIDGGIAVAVGMVHSLADAAAVLTFMKDWAATNRALSSSQPVPRLQPLFNPSLIDAAAAGNIDAQSPDPSILDIAATLPVHRFDHFASGGPSTPNWALPLTKIPRELASPAIKLGKPIPYHTWDAAAPCSHATFFLSAAETHAIYLRAAANTQARISHQDAVLAHFWAALIRARGLRDGEEHFLDVSIDARRRLQMPLPPSFIGSPILNVGVPTTATARTCPARDVADKAAAIREHVARFDGAAVAALLHEMCFELSGQRRWNCCLGDRHAIVTSWVGVGVEEVVFEEVKRVRWAQALIPSCDGVVIVGEGGVGGGDVKGGWDTRKEWWSKGVNLDVYLRSDVMRRLMEDEGVREFAEQE
ncbi:hypothetical protein IMSHALPRED_007270 [Imshaugia aleurites]|uniref:Uncharacterized protein n=1 Tax=Imshaugia aleurites TaxID=172621 RepID=A0A8H3FKJ1_9LECA|nr:hypothetical protein IMSHALPRED_007270 [Imshaugia aleurites]